jgi:UDP-N-acetyl-2-amino-2-deoxyglucuronate dehydrogenase
MKRFALIGAAGFIATRHLKAIKEVGGNLLCALDKFDSVGILDSYFPDTDFFTEFERFDRHIEKLKKINQSIDYLSVCSPNYLHDSHIRFGLRNNSNVICEKPLVLNLRNIDSLIDSEIETSKKVYTILQLRLHPSIIALKKVIEQSDQNKIHEIELTYITSRGSWYYSSWKGDDLKSGGIATNIGIHFFDMLSWVFGKLKRNVVHLRGHDRAAGYLEFEKARVKWFLSINPDTIPREVFAQGKRTYRALEIDNKLIEFSDGFTDLHTESYKQIIDGNGFGLEDARASIEIAEQIRNLELSHLKEDYHSYAKLPTSKHPYLKNQILS